MRARNHNLHKILQLLLVLTLTIVLSVFIWKLFIDKNQSSAGDYMSLTSISPDIIISLQQNKPDSWKEYAAIILAGNNIASPNKNELPQQLLAQLDRSIVLQELNWTGMDKKFKRSVLHIRKLLDEYPIYTPGEYSFPLEHSCYYIDTYGAAREGGERSHQGTDLFDKKGTSIFSVCDGTVEKIGWNRLGGERVGVRGNDGNYYYYAHLDTINQQLIIDNRIDQGDLIGTMGNTGDAITTPDHLHFGIELPNGEWLNPYPLLKVWEYHKLGTSQ